MQTKAGGPRLAAVLRRRMDLLRQIGRVGSISRAARAVGLSWRSAWLAVDAMNNLAPAPLVLRRAGGPRGGGTTLTEEGRRLVASFDRAEEEFADFFGRLRRAAPTAPAWDWIRRLSMRTSARNQFYGKVSRIKRGAVNSEVELALKGKDRVTAIITNESARDLELRVGREASALVKASWVMLAEDSGRLAVSARNKFRGIVERVTPGAVNTEVVLRTPGGDLLTAIVTRESERGLKVRRGATLWAFFKASSVILAVH